MSTNSIAGFGLAGSDTDQYHAEYAEIITKSTTITRNRKFKSPITKSRLFNSPICTQRNFTSVVWR